MPPRFAAFRSRTNSILDTITGAIPDAPPNGTFKDRSLTCRRCGNRFRDVLELDRHFNLLPEHSDYGDSHDYESFVRAKTSRRRSNREQEPSPSSTALTSPLASPLKSPSSFSDSSAFYQPQSPDKEQQDKPTFFRKLSTLTSTPLVADQGEASPTEAAPKNKGKGKARAFPQLRREDTGFTQVNSDDGHSLAHELPQRAGKSAEKPLPPIDLLDEEAVEASSIKSDSSFRTASSNGVTAEKSRIAARYAKFDSKKRSEYAPASDKDSVKSVSSKRPGHGRPRHASEGDLLLSTPMHHPEAPPPSYHELHGTTDPFDTADVGSSVMSAPTSPAGPRPWLSSRTRAATSNGFDAPWVSSNPPPSFPVTFSSNLDDDLSNGLASSSISKPRAPPRPWLSMNTTSQPSLVSSPPHSPTASPSTPRTPSNAFANFPLPLSPVSPSASSQTRDRRSSRTRSESNPASTRCPTCFAKYSSLASVLKHLDNSECGAVEFESGIV